jgi:excisionase family DNA binding protein
MNTSEAASYLRLAKPTLEKLRLTGKGPRFLKLGRAVRYERKSLNDWIAARSVASTSEQVAA